MTRKHNLRIAKGNSKKIPVFLTWSDTPPALVFMAANQGEVDAFKAGVRISHDPPNAVEIVHGQWVQTIDEIIADPDGCGVPDHTKEEEAA